MKHETTDKLAEALRKLLRYSDGIICYASTMEEHEPNKIVHEAQQALEAYETAKALGSANKVVLLDSYKPSAALTALMQATKSAEEATEPVGTEWTPCVKLPVTVHVRQQRPGESHVSTREGITPVKPDDLIMRGVEGEEYPIGKDLFERTYALGSETSAVPGTVQWCTKCGEGTTLGMCRRKDTAAKPLTDTEVWELEPMSGWFPQDHYRLELVVRATERACAKKWGVKLEK